MKKRSYLKISLVLVSLTIVLLFAGACLAGNMGDAGDAGKLKASEKRVYQVPQEKQDEWVARESMVQKEYEMCLEHCGFSDECTDKCSQIYNTRLDRAYKALMHK